MRPNPVPTLPRRERPVPQPARNLVDMRHELVRLSGLIDWKRFDEAFRIERMMFFDASAAGRSDCP